MTGIRFYALVFLVGAVISALSLCTLTGCGRSFQTGLYWVLVYSWPQRLFAFMRVAFVINTVFHGLSLVLATWLINLALTRMTNPVQSKLASVGVALVGYCLLLFVLFPMRECAL